MSPEQEAQLVAASRQGSHEAYGQLIQAQAPRVFALCLGILGRTPDAEDATQEALHQGYVQLNRLREDSAFAAWLRAIARSTCLAHLRRRKRQNALETRYTPPANTENHDHSLEEALARLPSEYRLPLVLYYFDQHRTEQIAATLRISPAGVLTRLSRARRLLREILDRQGEKS